MALFMQTQPAFNRADFATDQPDWGVAEASELGLPPGQWPRAIRIGHQTFDFVRFQRSAGTGELGDIVSAHYRSTGRSWPLQYVTILND